MADIQTIILHRSVFTGPELTTLGAVSSTGDTALDITRRLHPRDDRKYSDWRLVGQLVKFRNIGMVTYTKGRPGTWTITEDGQTVLRS